MSHPVRFSLRRPTRGQTRLFFVLWACLAVGGAGQYAANSIAERTDPVVRPTKAGELASVGNGWSWVDQPGAKRPGQPLVPAGYCASARPRREPGPLTTQTFTVEVSARSGKGIATFSNDAQVYLYIPKGVNGPGTYEARLWIVDAYNAGIAEQNAVDLHVEHGYNGFSTGEGLPLETFVPLGAYRTKVRLGKGQNSLNVRVRTALPKSDVSQLAIFNIMAP